MGRLIGERLLVLRPHALGLVADRLFLNAFTVDQDGHACSSVG
jgi:hypothetical protein